MGRIETANDTWRHDKNDPSILTVKFPRLPAIGVIDSKIPRTDGSLKMNEFRIGNLSSLWLATHNFTSLH